MPRFVLSDLRDHAPDASLIFGASGLIVNTRLPGGISYNFLMPLYESDLGYIQSVGFGSLAKGASVEIVRLLKNAAVPIKRVIDVGCGAGPLAVALVGAGFEVTGIDNSPDLLEIARTACPTARFIQASVYETPIPPCEAVIALGEPLTYHADSDGDRLVREFLRRVASILPSGGLFIFDLIELGEPSLTGRFWSAGEDWAVMAETTEYQVERTLVRRMETFRRVGELYRRGREEHKVRLFDSGDICEELTSLGFATRTAQSYGDQKLLPRRRAFFATRVCNGIVDAE